MPAALIRTLPLLLAAGLQVAEPDPASGGFDHEHPLWTAVLERHVRDDRLDYAALQKNREPLDRYLAVLSQVTPEDHAAWTREQRFAFWINAYNAFAVHLVVQNYPVDGIRDLGTIFNKVWDKRFIPLERFDPKERGRELSLDDIEHRILRPTFKDARIHAAVNCASISCPPLRASAFTAEGLETELDDQARRWLADPTRNRFEEKDRTLHASEIFKWFDEDFERGGGSVKDWILQYAPVDEARWMRAGKVRIRYLDYDWSLNDVARD